MPLPTIGDICKTVNPTTIPGKKVEQVLEGGFRTQLQKAFLNHPVVVGANGVHEARVGNLSWVGKHMIVQPDGGKNYTFIPAIESKASYGVVCGNRYSLVGDDYYVMSDQFGGCEYHELYHAGLNYLAFVHVYRGVGSGPSGVPGAAGSSVVQYEMAPGWVRRKVMFTTGLREKFGPKGDIWAVSLINRTVTPPTVQSRFICVDRSLPNPTVTHYASGAT